MTTHEIAARLGARASRKGKWIARCPAHDDGGRRFRSPKGRTEERFFTALQDATLKTS